MYSMVMMLAMTSATDIPACGGRRGGGCYGGGGGCYGGCYGSSYGGCYGSGYAYGGCQGGAYYGGRSGGYAYNDGYGFPSSGYAYSSYPSGVSYPTMGAMMPNNRYGYSTYPPGASYPTMGAMMPMQDGIVGSSGQVNWQQIPSDDGSTKLAAPVTLQVVVPQDAKLSIDGVGVNQTGSMRMFESPPIESGKDYYYKLTATATRDGKEVKTEKKVAVRAGQTTRATLDFRNGESENISRPNRTKPDNDRD
jgi:uncharacterized protein (TIGR03000 family)